MYKIFLALCLLPCLTSAQAPTRITDVNKGKGNSFNIQHTIAVFKGKLFLSLGDSVGAHEANWEPYIYDEINLPVRLVDLTPGYDGSLINYAPYSDYAIFNNKIFVCGGNQNTTGYELLAYDGINVPKVDVEISTGMASSQDILQLARAAYFLQPATP